MSDDEFGVDAGAYERTRAEDPINRLIMGEETLVYQKHLNPEQRNRYEFNKYLDSEFKPFQEYTTDRNRAEREKLLKIVHDLPEIGILNPKALAATTAFAVKYQDDIKGNIGKFADSKSRWYSPDYKTADILRYLRLLEARDKIKLN